MYVYMYVCVCASLSELKYKFIFIFLIIFINNRFTFWGYNIIPTFIKPQNYISYELNNHDICSKKPSHFIGFFFL